MTRLSTGLAATCQLKREGPVEMKELFTRAPWERDLKTPMTAVSRGTGDAGCVLASYSATRYVSEGYDANVRGMMLTPAGVWIPPRCQPHEVSGASWADGVFRSVSLHCPYLSSALL